MGLNDRPITWNELGPALWQAGKTLIVAIGLASAFLVAPNVREIGAAPTNLAALSKAVERIEHDIVAKLERIERRVDGHDREIVEMRVRLARILGRRPEDRDGDTFARE